MMLPYTESNKSEPNTPWRQDDFMIHRDGLELSVTREKPAELKEQYEATQ
jgi:hypothetical protein